MGLGNIGKLVAERAMGLRMKAIAYDPYLSQEAAKKLSIELVSLDELFRRSDVITVHTPLTDETRDLINSESFEKMKEGVIVINCARGGIVNEADMAEALRKARWEERRLTFTPRNLSIPTILFCRSRRI